MGNSNSKGPDLDPAIVAQAMVRLEAEDFTSEEWVRLFVSMLFEHMTLERMYGGSTIFNQLCEAMFRSPCAVLGEIQLPIDLEIACAVTRPIWYQNNLHVMQGLVENPMCPLWAEGHDNNFEDMLFEGIPIQVEHAMYQCFDMKGSLFEIRSKLQHAWKKLQQKFLSESTKNSIMPGIMEPNSYQMISCFVRSGLSLLCQAEGLYDQKSHRYQLVMTEMFQVMEKPAPRTPLSFLTDK